MPTRRQWTLTQKRLKDVLSYDPDTGLFTNLIQRRGPGLGIGGVAGGLNPSTGYIFISIDNERHKAHRLAWLYMTGSWPIGDIDHINHCRSDNRFCNLRDVGRAENLWNAKLSALNTSGFKGVTKHGTGWRAQIAVRGVRKMLGTYPTPEEASAAYVAAAEERRRA